MRSYSACWHPAASADAPAGGVALPPSIVLSTVTVALLADRDDMRARFIFETTSNRLSAATEATAAADVAALSTATAALADGDDIRALALAAMQH